MSDPMSSSLPRQRPGGPALPSTMPTVVLAGATAAGLALLTGPVVGYFVGVQMEASCSPTEMWCDLGAALVGVAAGIATSLITYVVAAVVGIVRVRPKGQRAREIAILLLAPVVLAALLSFVLLASGW